MLRLVVDDHDLARLATGGGAGEDGDDRQGRHGLGLAQEQVPHVAVVGGAEADRLGGIDGGAAAHGDDRLEAVLAAQRDALVDELESGVGLHAAELDELDAGGAQALAQALEQPARLEVVAPVVMEEHLGGAEGAGLAAATVLGGVAEDEARGDLDIKIVEHESISQQ